MICLSIVVVTGFVGQISLAQMAFAGISAFFVSKLSNEQGWPFPLPILAGAALATVVGVVVALPALRVRGVNLAIVTLAFAVAVDQAIFKNPSVNGGLALAPVNVPELIDQNRATTYTILGFLTAGDGKQPNPMTAIFVLVVAVVLVLPRASTSAARRPGARCSPLRSNERRRGLGRRQRVGHQDARVRHLGVHRRHRRRRDGLPLRQRHPGQVRLHEVADVLRLRLPRRHRQRHRRRSPAASLVAGGLVFTFLQNILHVPSEFTLILGGLGLIFTAILNPEGIAGAAREIRLQLAARLRRRPRRGASPGPAERTPAPALEVPQVSTLLQTHGMSVTFGGLRAVNEVDFDVDEGQLVGLIGPNGAGKTTFIDGVTGFVPTTGRIEFAGQRDRQVCRLTAGQAPVSAARGSRSSCSTT